MYFGIHNGTFARQIVLSHHPQRHAEKAANAANRRAKAAERKRIKQEKAARRRGVAPEDFVQPGYEPTIDPDLL